MSNGNCYRAQLFLWGNHALYANGTLWHKRHSFRCKTHYPQESHEKTELLNRCSLLEIAGNLLPCVTWPLSQSSKVFGYTIALSLSYPLYMSSGYGWLAVKAYSLTLQQTSKAVAEVAWFKQVLFLTSTGTIFT